MYISFIIPTIDHSANVKKCLDSILRSADRAETGVEILVIDQGKPGVAKEQADKRVVIYNKSKKGLSAARNLGIKLSKGEYLVFMDDDARVEEDFVTNLISLVTRREEQAFCGRLYDSEKEQYFSRFFLDSGEKYLKFGEFMHFKGSAHVIKKELLVKIGGYNTDFGAGAEFGGAEESDIFFRILQSGSRVFYSPKLVFLHPIHLTAEKVFSYSRSVSAMLTKQLVNNPGRALIYSWILLNILLKNFARAAQNWLLPGTIKEQNDLFNFKEAFTGSLAGIRDYIHYRNKTA
jgi:glycosyltransferase involved in cell wall biosynthesis